MKKILLTALILSCANLVQAADWSKIILCDTGKCSSQTQISNVKDLPTAYRNDVMNSKKTNKGHKDGDDYEEKLTLFLDNATFMGYPINKVEILDQYESGMETVYFENNDFLDLSTKLHTSEQNVLGVSDDSNVKLRDATGKVLPKASNSGAECGVSLLEFNPKKRTLAQSAGC